MNNDNQPEGWTFIAGAMGVAVVLIKAFPDLLAAPFRALGRWWQKPSKTDVLITATHENTSEFRKLREDVSGIRVEFVALNENVRMAVRESKIATAAVRIALDESRIGRWECDAHGHCVNANRALCNLFDLPKEQMLGTKWTQRITPSMRREVAEAFHRAYVDHESYQYAQNYAIEVNGKLINVRAQSVDVILGEDGKVAHMFGTCEKLEEVAA